MRATKKGGAGLGGGDVTNVSLTNDGIFVISKSIHVPSRVVKLVGHLTKLCKFNFCSICFNFVHVH